MITISELQEGMNRSGEDLKPMVGMTASMYVGSDIYPMVIVGIKTPKQIEVLHLDHDFEKYVENTDEGQFVKKDVLQKLIKSTNKEIFKLRKNGRWLPQGTGLHGTGGLRIGEAEYYRDPSF